MPRRISTKRLTRRVDLGDGDWVELLLHLSMGDQAEIGNSVVSFDRESFPQGNGHRYEKGAKLDPERYRLAAGDGTVRTLKQAIVAWGGPGFCMDDHWAPDFREEGHICRPMPITIENLADLDGRVGTKLVDLVNEENPEPEEDSPNPTVASAFES
jgi:hypothetical protein